MKKLISILIFMSFILICHSQMDLDYITFDDTTWNNYIFIDTVNYPNNIWQVGKPDKSNFNQAYSIPNAIVTDTLNFYPTNDTSVFYIRHITPDTAWGYWMQTFLSFRYKIDTDNNSDYGKIEFSPDNGITWIDYLTDTIYTDCYGYGDYLFTGFQEEWQDYWLYNWPDYFCFDINPGDTIWYKFIFISDAVQTGKEGWIVDNIVLFDLYEGIPEIGFNQLEIFPNPATSFITINIKEGITIEEAIIYNHLGQKALVAVPVNNTVDVSKLRPGIYFIEVITSEGRAGVKLVVE